MLLLGRTMPSYTGWFDSTMHFALMMVSGWKNPR
jgi:hypothetical protein